MHRLKIPTSITSVPPDTNMISEGDEELIMLEIDLRASSIFSLASLPFWYWLEGFCQLFIRLSLIASITWVSRGVVAL